MIDMEKVIKGLECIAQRPNNVSCGDCPYFRPFTDDPECGWCDKVVIADDAIALLKEQEPVKPEFRRGVPSCGKCGNVLANHYRNCPWCGYEVNWNG